MRYISAEQTKFLIDQDKGIVLDIRERYEYEICSINAIKIPMGEIVDRYIELPKNKSIVVMCRTGKRAEAVVNLLMTEFDFSDIGVMEGGILAWVDTNEPHLEKY